MNAGVAVQEKTSDPEISFRGHMLTELATWSHITEPKLLKAMLWAAMLARQPDYDSHEGFETVGTFIQESNAMQIIEALEKAYPAYLPKDRAEKLLKLKADLKAKGVEAETESPSEPASGSAPENPSA